MLVVEDKGFGPSLPLGQIPLAKERGQPYPPIFREIGGSAKNRTLMPLEHGDSFQDCLAPWPHASKILPGARIELAS